MVFTSYQYLFLNSIRYVEITNLKSVEWNALGKTLLFIGDDCFQLCNVIFVVCYEILWVVVFILFLQWKKLHQLQ